MDFPESIKPIDSEQKLFEKLSQDPEDFEALEYIRRQMRYIYVQEQKEKSGPNNTGTKVS